MTTHSRAEIAVLCVWLTAGSLAGCGGNVASAGSTAGSGNTAIGGTGAGGGSAVEAEPPLGWSIRDDTPYSRSEHATVLDEEQDRMLVIGGYGALDVWAFPLSGPDKEHWTQILPEGDSPPVDTQNADSSISAVYDPFGQRLLVLLADSYEFSAPRIWELSLRGTPTWLELALEGPSPGAELDEGKMVVDRDGKRVVIVGGGSKSSGTWAFPLDGPPHWSRIADTPTVYEFTRSPFPVGINSGALLVDARRARLVLVTGGIHEGAKVWTMPLTGSDWTLESAGQCGSDFDNTSTYDSANDRMVFLGGVGECGASTYSFASKAWQRFAQPSLSRQTTWSLSSIDDALRGRALFFSGGFSDGNGTSALGYDDLEMSVLVPNTRGVSSASAAGVWDPRRRALVAFGSGQYPARTMMHGLAPGDGWSALASARPAVTSGIYDPKGHAIVAIGHAYLEQGLEHVARLSSESGSDWEIMTVPDGPTVRARAVTVYDSANRRIVMHGGTSESGYPSVVEYDDTWALSLEGNPKWTMLATSGDPGRPRFANAAIYDAIGRRMITYGGSEPKPDPNLPGVLHELKLDDSLRWSELSASGTGPTHSDGALAVYDPEGQRMLVLDRGHPFALDLTGDPTWHRFCEPVMGLPGSNRLFPGYEGTKTLMTLVPDGLFVSIGDGAFRFNLNTPYCD